MRFVGRRDRCPASLRRLMEDMEERTAGNTRLDLWVAFDYGSRAEIVHAVRELIASGVDPADVDEERLRRHLYAPEMPDPDLVIRTSGEMRMSNFLLWQSAYAEFEFTTTLWPDFGGAELREALQRLRRPAAQVRAPVSQLLSRIVLAVPLAVAGRVRGAARRLVVASRRRRWRP